MDKHLFELPVEFSTLVELLRWRALRQPEQKAYTFLLDGEVEESYLTYGELDCQARAIGVLLQSCVRSGERALLLYPPGLEYIAAFFGCLYAGVVAVPAYPPQFNRPMPRLQAIVADAQATVVLTTTQILSNVERRFAHAPDLEAMRWLATDSVTGGLEDSWQETAVTSDTLAFLQYTSGSTAAPKGVMVSHGNLLHNERIIQRAFEHTEQSIVVGWLPLFHDMGLIGNMLQPLYLGIPCILMSPVAFLQRPLRWLQAISRYKATTSGGPNFAYDLCVSKITPEQQATLDLSSWSVAFNGAEPVRAQTLERFANAFTQCGFRARAFYPCYGMAETTLIVSGGFKAAPPVFQSVQGAALEQNRVVPVSREDVGAQTLVGCGQPLQDLRIVIAHPETLNRCAPDEVGEIWVAGPSVAQGYWNRIEQTKHTFRAYLADTGEGPFLRTGDLGFLKSGELFITGRLKDLIIIRGRNHYPQDIEWTVEQSHPALQPTSGAAFSINVAGEERLVVVQEVKRSYLRNLDVEEVIGAIRQAVAEQHELQVYAVLLLKTGSIPKTSSGKIQRHACRAGFLDGSLDVVGSSILEDSYSIGSSDSLKREALLAIEPEDRQPLLESYLQEQVARVCRVQPSQLNPQQPLSTLGLDSLMAVELKNDIETSLGVVLPMASFLQGPSIAQLATEVLNQLTAPHSLTGTTLAPAHESGAEHPLSYGQRALWFLHQLAPESPAYNIVSAVRLRAELNIPALQRAFQRLVERHPSLRTTFTALHGEPIQRVHEHIDVCFQKEDVSTWSEASLNDRLVEEGHRPFNLERGPLMRVSLFTLSAQSHILLLAMHHIVADFWSLAVLVHELGMLYHAEKDGTPKTLAPLALQYADYVRASAEMLASSEGERLWAYWQKQLAGELPVLNLPTDRPRPPVQTYRGTSEPFKLSAELSQRLKSLGRAHGTTLYMTLLAAFQVLLYRYTGQEDLLVGSPTAGRSWAKLAGLVGYFVNPVVLRTDLSGNPTFEAFLGQVRSSVLDAFEHQDYPFALLVERLQPVRDPSRSPLFQVMFVLQKAPKLNEEGLTSFALGEAGARMEMGGLELESFALEQRVAQFDLTLMMAEVDGGLAASLEYNTDLFDACTVHRMVGHFQTLLQGIVAHPEQRLSGLPLLTEAERQTLLVEWNDTQAEYPKDSCIHQLFEAQVERTPNAIAVVFEGEQLTYRELNYRANQLAHYLRALGVGPEALIGICMERSVEMVVGILGILKAGGAYVPLDPAYPQERLAFMLDDSQVPVLLTQEHLVAELPEHRARIICLDTDWATIAKESSDNPVSTTTANNLAYVIYTSGSTGKPKGAMNNHRGVCNRLLWMQDAYQLTETDRVLQKTPFSFDVSVWEFFWPLMVGARLVVAQPGGHRDTAYLVKLIAEKQITTLHFVPSMLQVFLEEQGIEACHCLRQVMCSGEALPFELQRRFFARLDAELHNLYGPTEAAIDVTFWACERESDRQTVPIGRPIANTQIYLLDSHLQPVPIGVPGELHIGGVGLARGYLNRPELTAEKFIPNPLSNEPGARLYKTGDLARYQPNGTIEYLGRIDNQVKIRGFRIELGEIEAVLSQHPVVRETVVLAREDVPGDKRLVAYVVPHQEQAPTVSELRSFLKQQLPEYMVPSAFVFLEALPLTPSGKVDRRALPVPNLGVELEGSFMAPRNPVEEVLAGIWAEVLGIEQVGVHNNFFELGGHSLLATQVVSRLRKAFQVELPLRSLFEEPTIAGLAERIRRERLAERRLQAPPLQKFARQEELPLSFSQWRLWFLDQLMPDNPVYNMFQALRLTGRLNVGALEQSFNEIVKRHEILRTTFVTVNDQPIQVIAPSLSLTIPIIDLTDLQQSEQEFHVRKLAIEEAQRSFNLSQGPLLRLTLLRLDREEYVLFLTMHHIISDHWSIGVLVQEVAAFYKAFSHSLPPTPLEDLPIQYADFAYWQRQWLKDEVLEADLAYWKHQLGGDLPVLELPTDRPRPATQTFKGAAQSFLLPVTLSKALHALSIQEGNTLFMTLLAAFAALLHRCSGQEDIIIGSPVANRTRVETERLIGFFVNTLALRIDLSGSSSYRELLRRVQKVALDAYEHQDLPFEKLVEVLQPKRHLSRAAVRQVVFALQNAPVQPIELPGVTISPMEIDIGTARLDLTLFMWEEGDKLKGMLEYNTDLFDAATIARFLEQFQILLEDMVADPQRQILTLPPLVEAPQQLPPQQQINDVSESIYELSNLAENQLLFWFAQKLQPDVQLYFANVPTTFTINGEVDIMHFQRAFQKLIDDSDSLRSVIYDVDGMPQRKVRARLTYQVKYVDFSGLSNPYTAFQDWLREQCLIPLNFEERLVDCALVKIEHNQFVWYLNVLHIISDGWSTSLIARYMSDYYRRSIEGNLESVLSIPSYQDYIDYERQYRLSDGYRQSENYWKQKLSTSLNLSRFYRTDSATQTTRTERISYDLGKEKSQKIKEIANHQGFFSPAIIFSTILFVYLYRVTGERTLRIGSPFANRPDGFKETIGLFMNACPLQVEIAENDTFVSLARKVQKETIQVARHQHSPVRNSLENKAYDVYYNYQNIVFTDFFGMPMKFDLIHSGHANDTLSLQVRDFDASGRFILDFDFKCDAFNEQQRQQSVKHFLKLLDSFLDGDRLLHHANMLSRQEQQQLLIEFNRTEKTYPQDVCLHQLIEAQVERNPEAIAVIYEDKQLTYSELNQRSNQLARFLRSLGVGPDVPVGICVERSLEMVVGLLGILKAGGAYMPLDPAYPAERLTFMLQDAQVPVLLTQKRLVSLLPNHDAKIVCLDSDWESISQQFQENLDYETTNENLAYVIYTSGSTGKPKGVMIPHRGICNRLFWMQEAYQLTDADRVLQKTPFSFDVSVWEFFWSLMTGACLVMARPGGHQDSAYLVEAIAKQKITTVHFVPSMLQVFLESQGLEACHSLKRVICSGEALPYQLQQRFFERLNAELHNLYGPTEASVDVTYWACERENSLLTVPIGRPIANTQIYILDQQLSPVPMGIPGELHIGGVGVARGYLNQPELTASKFIPNPFSQELGTRLYKTGDLARYLPDGNIEYLGRLDHQVKLRGFRIELGEIEAVLSQHPAIREVVLMAREDSPGNKRLVAYIVPNQGYSVTPNELRSFLREKLPEYMVPGAFVLLDTMPLTPNGKLDGKALPAPDQIRHESDGTFIAPRSPLEELIADIWTEILGVQRVGIHDNFFDLGGNSLLATQFISRLRQVLLVELPLRSVFEAPTVAELAEMIAQTQAEQQDEETQMMAQILSELEQLSEDEVNALLLPEQNEAP